MSEYKSSKVERIQHIRWLECTHTHLSYACLSQYRMGGNFRAIQDCVLNCTKISWVVIPPSTCIIFVPSATHEKREIKKHFEIFYPYGSYFLDTSIYYLYPLRMHRWSCLGYIQGLYGLVASEPDNPPTQPDTRRWGLVHTTIRKPWLFTWLWSLYFLTGLLVLHTTQP